jgi:agmatinase
MAALASTAVLPHILVQAGGLMLEAQDDAHVVVVDTETGRRAQLSRGAYRLLSFFSSPVAVASVLDGLPHDSVVRGLHQLYARGLLLDANRPAVPSLPLRHAAPFRFCHAPAATAGQPTDIAILGVPYDLGGQGNHRDAPNLLRTKSLDYVYLVGFDSGKPLGWHDVSAGRRILAGVTLSDAGDVGMRFGESQAELFDRIGSALMEPAMAGSLPVLLGGDATITLAAVRQLALVQPLSVVRIAATAADADAAEEAASVEDVGRRLAGLAGVSAVFTVGTPARDGRSSQAQRIGTQPGGAAYLSIDLAAMDFGTPPTGTGFALEEMLPLISGIGQRHRIVGMDVIGLDMDAHNASLAAIVACHVLLHAMDVAIASRSVA